MFVVLNAAALILRTIFDTFAPPGFAPHSYQMRSSLSTYAAVGTFLLAGCYAGYRMGRANAGTLAAVTASAVGHALALGFDVVATIYGAYLSAAEGRRVELSPLLHV